MNRGRTRYADKAADVESEAWKGVVVTVEGEPIPDEAVTFREPDPMFYIAQVVEALKLPHILRREPSQADDIITIQFEGGIPIPCR